MSTGMQIQTKGTPFKPNITPLGFSESREPYARTHPHFAYTHTPLLLLPSPLSSLRLRIPPAPNSPLSVMQSTPALLTLTLSEERSYPVLPGAPQNEEPANLTVSSNLRA